LQQTNFIIVGINVGKQREIAAKMHANTPKDAKIAVKIRMLYGVAKKAVIWSTVDIKYVVFS
jgi:hypothetical protein